MRLFLILPLLFFSSVYAQTNQERLEQITELKRIAFGSCNNEADHQPLWKDILKQEPDLFIWGGDNVYVDWKSSGAIQDAYAKQNSHPDYQKLKAQVPIIGVWDDHDYAFDNANGSYINKWKSQMHFLDFMEVPADSPRRNQEGIYTSYEYGPEKRKVKIIMLDNRYFKDLDSAAPMLGEVQWRWLEEELANSTASLHFIVGGLSIFSPLIPYSEEWAHYPGELERMNRLLRTYNPKGVVFLTGDKHFASIFQYYGQLEFMSSGMTHIAPRKTWWYLGRKYPRTFFGLNYGQIDIQWEESTPVIRLSIRDRYGRDIHPTSYRWSASGWERR